MIVIYTWDDLNDVGRAVMGEGELDKLDPSLHLRGESSVLPSAGHHASAIIFATPQNKLILTKARYPGGGVFRNHVWAIRHVVLQTLIQEGSNDVR